MQSAFGDTMCPKTCHKTYQDAGRPLGELTGGRSGGLNLWTRPVASGPTYSPANTSRIASGTGKEIALSVVRVTKVRSWAGSTAMVCPLTPTA